MNFRDKAREVLDLEIAGLQKVRDDLDASFDRGAWLILTALRQGGKVVVTGIGKNLHIAQKVSATLASTGSTSVVLHPSQAMHGDLGILREGDVLLTLSYSGESEELLSVVPQAKRLGVKIVALTGNADSALAACSDVVIPVAVDREACPFNMAPTTSTTATLAIGDALAMALLDASGFRREDYATLHPGGAIGRALLIRVADIMRGADRLPAVRRKATVRDAIIAMTQAHAGSAGIVDSESKLLGIFTDGDLRRHLSKGADVLDMPVETVMTPSPVVVREDQLAVDVLRVFEDNTIDDLLVVDAQGRLVGMIDIQDLPKLKIM